MKAGGVAESYLDPLAVVLQSIRPGKDGRGWRRFLVFAELTKSKKGVDYVALFVYFQFKGAIRIILAEGPRIVINGITLWAAFKSNLAPEGVHAGDGHTSPFEQFFINVKVLYELEKEHALVLFTMMFTLVIWVFSAISLIIALILYLVFLWHYIPSSDGRLRNYCRRKIDSRLDRIIGKKTRKALEKQEAKAQKATRTGQHSAGMPPKRQPTLPVLADNSSDSDNTSQFTFSTTDTRPTLLPFGIQPPSRTNTPGSVSSETGLLQEHPTLPNIDPRPGPPTRTNTQLTAASDMSYTSTISNAPLLRTAGDMGRSDSPTMPLQPRNNQPGPRQPPIDRSFSSSTAGPQHYMPPRASPVRLNSPFGPPGRASPAPTAMSAPPMRQDTNPYNPPRDPLPTRSNTAVSAMSRAWTPGPNGHSHSRAVSPVSPLEDEPPLPGQSCGIGMAYQPQPDFPLAARRPSPPHFRRQHQQHQQHQHQQHQQHQHQQGPGDWEGEFDRLRATTPLQQLPYPPPGFAAAAAAAGGAGRDPSRGSYVAFRPGGPVAGRAMMPGPQMQMRSVTAPVPGPGGRGTPNRAMPPQRSATGGGVRGEGYWRDV
ncbi:hypothetical protein W97_07340 [Coniosporium apollinis CBS 100218]|uniref:Pheromone-regulated membrane protein 6 n=1 Tax=Coniosporium apollinis (strain CBS 100218) TaxID=1168221 RepID=R7Z2Q4_CONA1|nr:uncharacterized protein W97_07340 [Coniosporium apollinis CBS 100218]EON68191.1 hypothetical protein W97_07340 [Coniosporium apollinis CBS 100218]